MPLFLQPGLHSVSSQVNCHNVRDKRRESGSFLKLNENTLVMIFAYLYICVIEIRERISYNSVYIMHISLCSSGCGLLDGTSCAD